MKFKYEGYNNLYPFRWNKIRIFFLNQATMNLKNKNKLYDSLYPYENWIEESMPTFLWKLGLSKIFGTFFIAKQWIW